MRINRIRIITLMAEQDVNIKTLAEKVGLSRMTVSGIRCGKSCSYDSAAKIAAGLGVDVSELLEDDRKAG